MTRKNSIWRAAIFWGITAIYATSSLLFFTIAILLFLGAPFWVFPDVAVSQATRIEAPWSMLLTYGSLGLAVLLLAATWGVLKAVRSRRGLGVHAVLCFMLLAVAAAVCRLLARLPHVPRHELSVIQYAAMDYVSFAAASLGLVLFAFLLRFFQVASRPRLRNVLLLLLLLAFGFVVVDPLPPRIVAGPWLQLAGKDSMTVMWLTDRASIGWVEFGDALELRAPASRYGLVDTESRLHRATLSGLSPGSRVSYRVAARKYHLLLGDPAFLAAETRSGAFTFRVPDAQAGSTVFAVISDLHEHIELLPHILAAANLEALDFVVFNGDIFDNVVNEYQVVTRFLRPVSRLFGAEKPFVFVRGNHDARGPFAHRLPDYLSLPGDPFLSSFRMGPASFLVFDTGEDKPDDDVEYQGLADFKGWLEEESRRLESLSCVETWRNAPFRVLLAHIPVESGMNKSMSNRLREANLDVQFAGHYHNVYACDSALGFPIIIASGMAWANPDEFAAAVVHVDADRMDISLVTPAGAKTPFRQIPAN